MPGNKMREDQLQAVWFAAGTAAFITCIERAVVVSLFAHYWRLWAFLALNLLLLAILFTSSSQSQKNPSDQIDQLDDDDDSDRKKTTQDCRPLMVSKVKEVGENGGGESVNKLPERGDCLEYERKNSGDDFEKLEAEDEISKEELNQRVEAFIATFRQQYLVCDAKGRSFLGLCPDKGIMVNSHGVKSP